MDDLYHHTPEICGHEVVCGRPLLQPMFAPMRHSTGLDTEISTTRLATVGQWLFVLMGNRVG